MRLVCSRAALLRCSSVWSSWKWRLARNETAEGGTTFWRRGPAAALAPTHRGLALSLPCNHKLGAVHPPPPSFLLKSGGRLGSLFTVHCSSRGVQAEGFKSGWKRNLPTRGGKAAESLRAEPTLCSEPSLNLCSEPRAQLSLPWPKPTLTACSAGPLPHNKHDGPR